jgi:hypothetical protein
MSMNAVRLPKVPGGRHREELIVLKNVCDST